MKKSLFLLISIIFISCSSPNTSQNQTEDKNDSNQESPTTQSVSILIENSSQFDVNVYIASNHPYYGKPNITVPSNSQINYSFIPNEQGADVFYFQYLINVGNVKIPYFAYEQSKTLLVQNENKTLVIDELQKNPTNSAYLIIENKTNSQVYLKSGNTIKTPFDQENEYIFSNNFGLYEVSENIYNDSNSLTFGACSQVKISTGASEVKLPNNLNFEKGNIYTVVLNGNKTVLKSIVPFDIDVKNKIWKKTSINSGAFYTNSVNGDVPIIRTRKNLSDGFVVAGTLRNDTKSIAFLNIDSYGNEKLWNTIEFKDSNERQLKQISVIDFMEDYDGSFVMLLQRKEVDQDGDEFINSVLLKYCFLTNTLHWTYSFEDSKGLYLFRKDSRGKIIPVAQDKYCIVGGYLNFQDGTMHHVITMLDCSARDSIEKKEWVRGTGSNYMEQGIEEMMTSAYFDGTNVYACGYMFDFDYSSSAQIHKSVVYKFDLQLNDVTQVYTAENTLLFGIDGTADGNWCCCGEFTDTGSILKGCFVTNALIENEKTTCYVGPKSYTWFTQLCIYNNNIVLCGQSSNNMAGTDSSMPVIVSFDKTGNLQWENNSAKEYSTALNCIPNSIGTYIVQLYNSTNHSLCFASADLLGNI